MAEVSTPPEQITIAILTYKRPQMLQGALRAVAEQAVMVQTSIEILVVDNDPQRSALDTVTSTMSKVPIRYLSEQTPGIAAARNAALSATVDSRLLIFFDDDEIPCDEWLANLLSHWEVSQCAAVAGPVLSRLPEEIPNTWVVASGVFDRVRYATGTRKSGAGAGNLLLDMDFLRRHDLRFDQKLGLQGGEDTLLTHQIVAKGGVIEWCDEAVAVESVPPDRITHAWMRRRLFRSGASWSKAELRTAGPLRGRIATGVVITLRSGVKAAVSSIVAGVGFLQRNQERSARNLRDVYANLGAIAGLMGGHVSDYSRQ